jgi:3-hydroxyisobutyrate dehydrogenase
MRAGVLGVGAMGSRMAANLARAGWLVGIWNRTGSKAETLAAQIGVPAAASPAELARGCDLLITCVSRDADLEAVVRAMEPGLQAGATVVDTSTVASDTARRLQASLARQGVGFLDAPVSGGVEGAARGTLVMMVGGSPAILDRVRPALESIAARIVHMGPTGSGQATKAVNQVLAAGISQAVTEALAFGETMGLAMERVVEVVSGGAAGSWFLSHRGLSMLRGEFAPGFRVALHQKDLQIALAMVRQHVRRQGGPALPLAEQTVADYQRLIDAGHGDEDISALYRLKRP